MLHQQVLLSSGSEWLCPAPCGILRQARQRLGPASHRECRFGDGVLLAGEPPIAIGLLSGSGVSCGPFPALVSDGETVASCP